jgi:hypothetical protein
VRDGKTSNNSHSSPARVPESTSCSEDWVTDREIHQSSQLSPSPVHGDNEDSYSHTPLPKTQLSDWSESNPSTPTKPSNSSRTENWDDDFEDKQDSPIRNFVSHPLEAGASSRKNETNLLRVRPRPPIVDSEFWEDFPVHVNNQDENMNTWKRARHDTYSDSSDDDGEFGFTDKDEDKTVTARSRPRALLNGHSPPPPVPALPASFLGNAPNGTEPFPRSPSESLFSTQTGRNSSSATNLALRRTLSSASSTLALLPPSPPIHRERRRLRKKSRPPHIESNVFELQDQGEPTPTSCLPTRSSTPERASSPMPSSSEALASPASTKVPLISRISSVKRWGARKKRESTTPSEIAQEVDNGGALTALSSSSALAQSAQTAKSGNWFFRGSGGGPDHAPRLPMAETNEEKSQVLDSYLGCPAADTAREPSPTKLNKRRSLAFVNFRRRDQTAAEDGVANPPALSAPRRPASMQPPANSRHISYSNGVPMPTSTSTDSSASISPASASVEELQPPLGECAGSKGPVTGARKVSLMGGEKKHKRNKSSGATEHVPSLAVFLSVPAAPAVSLDVTTRPNKSTSLAEFRPPSPQYGDSVIPSKPTYIKSVDPILPPEGPSGLGRTLVSMPGGVTIGGSLTPPMKAPSSPQTASLGRSTPPLSITTGVIPRRNSLGDLKIPTRISEAQVALRRDLSMVREFAANVECKHNC